MALNPHSSVDETKAHDTALLKSLASKFNLTYRAFGVTISDNSVPSSGTLTLSDAFNDALEPAPITPTGKNATPYQLLSGTVKATYNAHRSLEDNNTITVGPGLPSGNSGE
jgi:Gly-Xaa carboxypeptidase